MNLKKCDSNALAQAFCFILETSLDISSSSAWISQVSQVPVMDALNLVTKQASKEVKAWATALARTVPVQFCSLKTHKGAEWHSEHWYTWAWGRSSRDVFRIDCNPHSLSLQCCGWGGKEVGRKVETRKKGQVGRRCFKIWVCFLYPTMILSVINIGKNFPKLNLFCP